MSYLSIVTFACYCNGEDVDLIYYSKGVNIFTGRVISAKISSFNKEHRDKEFYYQEVTLEIIGQFKGDTARQVTIIKESFSNCGISFKNDEEYLIYPFRHPEFGPFMVHQSYMRMGKASYKVDDTARLRELKKG